MSYAFPNLDEVCDEPPRVLNLHLGQPHQSQLAAVNILVSSPAVKVTASYPKGHFVIVRSAGITDALQPQDIMNLFKEWKRILHRFGFLHLDVSTEKAKTVTSLLRKSGFSTVGVLKADKDLFRLSGYSSHDANRTILFASRSKLPHSYKPKLSEPSFKNQCAKFCKSGAKVGASFVIPVYNEAASLPGFLRSLEASANLTETPREFIFVLNGCTDESESIIKEFIKKTALNCRIITSAKGIMTAFLAGVSARKLSGFVGKLDADVVMDNQALDLLQMHLIENAKVMAAYSEPLPRSPANPYNLIYFQPSIFSQRLFYIGQTCLLRSVPFDRPTVTRMVSGLQGEDIFLNQYFIYFFGFESIAQVPHAHTYVKTIDSMDGMVRAISRLYSEVRRVNMAFPPFTILTKVLGLEFYSPEYQKLYAEAMSKLQYVEDWTRIESMKGS
jgi:glycosyltransferase involved in cell wall biosynthesis